MVHQYKIQRTTVKTKWNGEGEEENEKEKNGKIHHQFLPHEHTYKQI